MFAGEPINITEHRAVLHIALRAPAGTHVEVDGHDVVPDVHEVLAKMGAFADKVRSGEWTGADRPPRCATSINIGIGGSHLGPAMAALALRNWSDRRPAGCASCPTSTAPMRGRPTHDLDPAETLVDRVVEDVHHASRR